jgi:hypothetical protein
MCDLSYYVPERFMTEFCNSLSLLLAVRPDVSVIVLRPLYQSSPVHFSGDLAIITVGVW